MLSYSILSCQDIYKKSLSQIKALIC